LLELSEVSLDLSDGIMLDCNSKIYDEISICREAVQSSDTKVLLAELRREE
jgi:hypothetical protein